MVGVKGVGAYFSLKGSGVGVRGGRLFEAGRLLTFSTFRMGAYSRWALIRGWALIRINKVLLKFVELSCGTGFLLTCACERRTPLARLRMLLKIFFSRFLMCIMFSYF